MRKRTIHEVMSEEIAAIVLMPVDLADPTKEFIQPSIAIAGELGHTPLETWWKREEAEEHRDRMNASYGWSPEDAEHIMYSTMFPRYKMPKLVRKTKDQIAKLLDAIVERRKELVH